MVDNSGDNSKISKGGVLLGGTFAIIYLIIYFFWAIIWLYAIYLSFKCNNGFSFVGFLGACCCSPCYAMYKSVKC
tara:strand:- start:299 stop:523 length:225 start_codon:yes stop_codon:yes gene_type:complete